MKNRSIILRKTGGFYQVFDDDAYIISYLFSYKVINNKCGFPLSALCKVVNTLEDKKINYIIKNEEEEKKDYKRLNNYNKYLDKSIIKRDIDLRIDNILNKLREFDKDKLDDLLKLIEDKIYE